MVEKATLLENGFGELGGVDFDKGCFIGQELTARMRYRGLVRRRLMPVRFEGERPEPGTIVRLGEREAGEMRSSIAGHGLALLRLDRIAEAREAGTPLLAGDTEVVPSSRTGLTSRPEAALEGGHRRGLPVQRSGQVAQAAKRRLPGAGSRPPGSCAARATPTRPNSSRSAPLSQAAACVARCASSRPSALSAARWPASVRISRSTPDRRPCSPEGPPLTSPGCAAPAGRARPERPAPPSRPRRRGRPW